MKQTNRIFLFVLLLLFGVVSVTWQVLQTEWFGQLLNQKISVFAKKKAGVDISFERVEVGMFPLATRLKNIKITHKETRVNAVSLGLEFGFRDILSDDFSIGNVVLENAILDIDYKSSGNEKEPLKRSELFQLYKTHILKSIPFDLRGIELKNSLIKIGKSEVDALDIKANLFQNIISVQSTIGFSENFFKLLGVNRLQKINLNGVNGEIQLTSKYIRFKDLKVYSQNSFIEIDGKLGHDDNLQEIKVDSFLDLKKIKKILREDEVNPNILPTGMADIKGRLNGKLESLVGSFSFNGNNLSSKVYRFGSLSGELSLKENTLFLNKASGTIGGGTLKLTESTPIVDVKTVQFLYPDLFLDIANLYTNNIFFFLPNLDKAKGYLKGPLKLSIKKKNLEVITYEGFQISNFRLLGEKKDVLINPLLNLGTGSRVNASYDGAVKADVSINFKGTNLELKGDIGGGRVDMSILPGEVDLEAFGPISGLQLYGQGAAQGSISGTFDNVDFNFDLAPRNFKMIGFELGTISGNINFNTGSSLLTLKRIKGNNLGVMYNMDGTIDFKSDLDALNMRVIILKANLDSAKTVMKPVFAPMIPYFKNVKFNFESALLMRGGLTVPKMDVRGRISASNVTIFAEDMETVNTDVAVKDNIVRFENIVGKKVTGTLTGRGEYNMTDKNYSYKGTLTNLRIKDLFYYRLLNLGLDGDAYGEFQGIGSATGFSSRSHLRITNSNVENVRIQDSVITVFNNNKDVYYSSSFVGGEASVEGYLNLGKSIEKLSTVNIKVDTQNLRSFAGILGRHNIANKAIRGRLKTSLEANFDIKKPETLNLLGRLEEFNFNYPGIRVSRLNLPIVLKIENGSFKEWNYEIVGDGVTLKSIGTGNLKDKFKLEHKFTVNSSLAELLTDKIVKSQGTIKGEQILVGSIKNIRQILKLGGDGLSLKAKNLPGLISNLSFDMSMEDNKLYLNKSVGEYGNGRVEGKGEVHFIFPFPEISIRLNVEKTRFPILKRSGVVVSGDLELAGKKLPYDLKGNLAIIKGEVIEEMNDLASSAINSDSYQRFIPVGYLEGNVGFINTELNLSSFTPIKIKNGLIDIGLGGNLKIFGSISSPKFNGELSIENPENKFLFKGHEFLLSEGIVRFIDGNRKESPELRFSGISRINEYDVYINLRGPADNLTVEMSSNPTLSQEDILSLLTLGVTSDVSRNLGDRQRQSVTTLSIGSLIMDQLKINQSLNDSLGLRLSIQPEFIEDENNLLEGRVDDRAGGNRFRSQTVLKVQKKVSKKVNLSLSSTVGGSVDQSQEMNVNYKINKSWSLEGVYEVRSNDELEQELPDSVGADVKYQWSF